MKIKNSLKLFKTVFRMITVLPILVLHDNIIRGNLLVFQAVMESFNESLIS